MNTTIYPLQILLTSLAGWVNRRQQAVIDYIIEENRALKKQIQGRKLLLTDNQRRRLAVKGKVLGRELLAQVATIVTPDTILAWHRKLIAAKWTYSSKRPGRPSVIREITKLILRIAKANPSWDYDKIQGALENLGHQVSPSTIGNILKRHGIEPAPERGKRTSWRTFLKAHFESITAADFFTTEVWTLSGLITYYTVFFMDLATRTVHFAGTTPNPNGMFIAQVARNLTDAIDGFLLEKRFLIIDRDKKFTEGFKHLIRQSGMDVILCPAKAPNCNAYAERFLLSLKSECLNRMIFFGEASLRRAISGASSGKCC